MSFKRNKKSGVIDFGSASFDGQHSRKCFVVSNPNGNVDDYPWDGKPEPDDPDPAVVDGVFTSVDENTDPNLGSPQKVRKVEKVKDTRARAPNVTEDMKQLCDAIATTNLTMRPSMSYSQRNESRRYLSDN